MSDPKYGEPVEETPDTSGSQGVDDVVGSANESLADAEAASNDAVTSPEPAASDVEAPAEQADAAPAAQHAESAADKAAAADAWDAEFSSHGHGAAPAAPVTDTAAPAEPATGAAVAGGAAAAYSARDTETSREPEAYRAPEAYREPVTTSYADTSRETATEPVVPATPQPIFVQAPEAPRVRGNRGAAGAIGLLAAVVFALLYLAAALGLRAAAGEVTGENFGTEALAALTSWWFWVPVAVFFIGFWLLGAIINRGRWGHWVVFGLFVGVAAYGGHLLGQLFEAQFWTLTASAGAELVGEQLLAPLAIVAFVIGREITIWFGAWVSSRGKRVTELNNEAQREYERTLEAGPQLHRQ